MPHSARRGGFAADSAARQPHGPRRLPVEVPPDAVRAGDAATRADPDRAPGAARGLRPLPGEADGGRRGGGPADVFRDGHEALRAVVLARGPSDAGWSEFPMRRIDAHVGGDRWAGSFEVTACGPWAATVEAWVDPFASWREELARKVDAGQVGLESELSEGALLLERTLEELDAAAAEGETPTATAPASAAAAPELTPRRRRAPGTPRSPRRRRRPRCGSPSPRSPPPRRPTARASPARSSCCAPPPPSPSARAAPWTPISTRPSRAGPGGSSARAWSGPSSSTSIARGRASARGTSSSRAPGAASRESPSSSRPSPSSAST